MPCSGLLLPAATRERVAAVGWVREWGEGSSYPPFLWIPTEPTPLLSKYPLSPPPTHFFHTLKQPLAMFFQPRPREPRVGFQGGAPPYPYHPPSLGGFRWEEQGERLGVIRCVNNASKISNSSSQIMRTLHMFSINLKFEIEFLFKCFSEVTSV